MANSQADQKLLDLINGRAKRGLDAHDESRQYQLDDLKFAAGNSDNNWQWRSDDLAARAGDGTAGSRRPCLTINQLPQHINQVTNEQRQNRPAGKVLPVDDKADVRVAKVYNGIIRHIEVGSDSDIAIDAACAAQVVHGEGFFRIIAEYCDPMSFDQDLKLRQIKNAFSVSMDPDIQDPTGADQKWCFITSEYEKTEFEAEFPNADAVSWEPKGRGDELSPWFTSEGKLRVAEFYWIEQEKATICLWPDGQVTIKGSPKEQMYLGLQPVKERETQIPRVKWCKTNGHQILGKIKDIPGSIIPVFRVVGNEWVIEGETIVSGIVRNAKDPQRMVNYWTSQEAEMLALAPKAPFVGYAGQFEGFESKWRLANVKPFPYLEVNPEVNEATGQVLPLPQRMAPPMPPSGIIEAKLQALDAVKQTTGQYNPSLGAQSNETSGKAIIARQRESDVGTYHYVDNLSRAVRSYCRYLIEVIPTYYDARKVARILGEDGEASHARLDPTQATAVVESKDEKGAILEIYNLSVGKYDVVAAAGASYTTKRLEALDMMSQLLQGNPELWAVMGDLLAKNMDWPGAEEIAERLKKWIAAQNPNLIGDDKGGDPKLEQAMQMVEQLSAALEEAQASIEQQKVDIQAFDAETKRLSALGKVISPEYIESIVVASLHSMLTASDIDPGEGEQPMADAGGAMPPMLPPEQPPAAEAAPLQ